jgi:hypothetical protein
VEPCSLPQALQVGLQPTIESSCGGQLFGQLGFNELEAEKRARLFSYYEMAEPAMFATQSKETRERPIEARHRLLTTDSDRTFD